MPLNQKGLAPIIVIGGLFILGFLAATGTYFALELSLPKKEPIIAAPQPSAPQVSETLSIEEVKAANEETLLNMEGVEKVELGEKDGEPCVVVFTFEETDELQNLENTGLDGYKVVIQNASN